MHRIDGDNVAVALPTPQAVGATVGFFAAEDVAPATQVTGDWLNAVQEEIANAVEDSGITLSKTVRTQLHTAIRARGGTWRRTVPLGSGGSVHYVSGDSGDILVTQTGVIATIARASADACAVQIAYPIPADIDGIALSDFFVRVRLETAFTGTVTMLAAKLYKVQVDGTSTELGSANLNGLTVATWFDRVGTTHFSYTPDTLEVGEGLYLQINASIDGGGAGELRLSLLGITQG